MTTRRRGVLTRAPAVRAKDLDSCPDFKGPAGRPAVIENGAVTVFARNFNK